MESHPGETVERQDLLQKLISMYEEAGLSISNKDLFHQIFTFMVAGHETTSLSMAWFIFLLAKYHHYQPRLRKEIMEAMDGGSEITFDSLDKLRCLDNFIKETMRLYPVALIVGRQARNADKIGPYTIPAGTRFYINIASLNRNKDHWTHPDEFNPERFDLQGIVLALPIVYDNFLLLHSARSYGHWALVVDIEWACKDLKQCLLPKQVCCGRGSRGLTPPC